MSLQPKDVDFEKTWTDLQETVRRIVTMQYVPRAVWNDRFSDVYSLCVSFPDAHADKLYEETRLLLGQHVKDLKEQVKMQGLEENIGLLRAYHAAWVQYSQGIVYLSKLYSYLNMQHVKKQQVGEMELTFGLTPPDPNGLIEIGELGLKTWKKEMIEPLRVEIVKLLLEAITDDRMGKPNFSLTDVIRVIIQSFVDVQLTENKKKNKTDFYEEIFEGKFLEATGQFYKCEAAKLMQQCTISQYLEKVQQRLNDEALRVRRFVHESTYQKAREKCEQYFVSDHLHSLQAECENMVQQERKHDLRNIYPLLRPVNSGLNILVEQFYNHLKNKGLEAIANLRGENIQIQFVENMLDLHRRYRELIEDVFRGDQALNGAMDRACAWVINHKQNSKQPCRSPELLAKYCDTLLKKSSKGLNETEIEEKLTKSIVIFRYIDDKDVYQKFYSKMLARRLIHQQSQSMDAEEAMINKLKQACGFEFTNKLHRMYTDVSLSADLNTKFQDYVKTSKIDLGLNFHVHVLQAGAWPLGPNVPEFHVPQELAKCVQIFEEFYKHSFNGRRLTWYHHLCQGELKLTYLQKPYIISMQTFQMAIMLLYESTDELTGQEILAGIELVPEQLQKQIQSLVDAKLLIDPDAEFSPTTVYRLNLNYTNKRTRFKIGAGMFQQTQSQEIHTTIASVEEDRKLVLQAAIVRIMKSRKMLKHNTLVQEVLTQKVRSFQPSVQMIKKCIEALIDKQYIERTANSQDEYSYVA